MADVSLFNPFRALDRFEPFGREMEDAFKGFFLTGRQVADIFKGLYGPQPSFANMTGAPSGHIPIDVSEDGNAYTVRAEVPGFNKDEVQVSIEGNQVIVSAATKKENEKKNGGQVVMRECYCGSQYRAFTLPQPVDDTKATAKYTDGVLELVLPKKSAAAAKTIAIS
jgi:HSP20 family protein